MKWFFGLVMVLLALPVLGQYAEPCSEAPELNTRIVKTLEPWIGKKIARGECWDAVALALNTVGAEWDGLYNFGRVVNVNTECIQPGDIVQFENVVVEVKTGNSGYTETFTHHTAVVYKVTAAGKVELIHQNTGQFGRKMGVSPLDLSTVTKGKLTIYRPVAGTG